MDTLSIFQRNNLIIGNELAVEVQSSSPEIRAFVVIGAYIQTVKGAVKPSKFLNAEQSNLRFWMRKYEINASDLENDLDITDHDLINSIYLEDIQTIEDVEAELEKYLQDFSLMEVGWKVDYPFP